MNRVYSEFSFYSPMLDSDCIRISVSDGRTGEFFSIIPNPGYGKSLLKARDAALAKIESAMDSGLEPGEVK